MSVYTYNFEGNDLGNGYVTLYLWNGTIRKRGSTEKYLLFMFY